MVGMSPSVLVIGAGLVGTSVGMALRAADVEVFLEDRAASHALVAASLGAGQYRVPDAHEVDLVVVATPPLAIPDVVCQALERFPDAVVTDVGSVKSALIRTVQEKSAHSARFVASHPMAGSQFTGPMTASAQLFQDRTWVITATDENAEASVEKVRWLARTVGSVIVEIDASAHDEAVAQVSHVPHLMSIVTASHLRSVPGENLRLAGQGIRDVTRIAGSDTALWTEIISSNSQAIRRELREVADDLCYLIDVLERPGDLEAFLQLGQHGAQSLLVKHGQEQAVEAVVVEIPDEPRALARLFGDIGNVGFNVEDFELTHDAVREVGYLSIAVEPTQAEALSSSLQARGWRSWKIKGDHQ